jgi:predicted tellurium resistance membrane protein TerC
MNVLTNRFGTTAFKRALLLGIVAAFLMSFTVAQTLTTTSQSSTVFLGGESFTADADVSLVWKGLSKAGSNQTALGDTAPGIEATTGLAAVRTAIVKNNYVYAFEVKEALVASWPAARQ